MDASSLPEKHFHVRSISLPTRSHPFALKVEECLNRLRTWEISASSTASTSRAQTIQVGLVGLLELCNCVNDLIHVPLIQQVLAHPQHENFVDEALNMSVGQLDICGTTKDALLMIKGGIQDLQSALRRKSGGDSSIENQIKAYISLRKNMKKNIKTSLAVLKKWSEKNVSLVLDKNQHVVVVVKVLREVSIITISIFQYLLSCMSSSVTKKKVVGWSLVSNFMKNRSVACEMIHENANEMESVDITLHNLCRQNSSSGADVERLQTTHRRLKTLEISIEGLEDRLERIYRRLIQTRVSLLNVRNR